MDGFQFLDAYNKLDFPGKSSVVIVILTTSMNPADVVRAEKAGIADYMSKLLTEEKISRYWEIMFGSNM